MNYEKCNGCRVCEVAYPYGVIWVTSKLKKALKCDLCNGDPECVKYCPEQALTFVDTRRGVEFRRINSAAVNRIEPFPFIKHPR